MKSNDSFESWSEEFAKTMSMETFRLIDASANGLPDILFHTLMNSYISNLIKIFMLSVLKERPSGSYSKKEAYEFAIKNFSFVKSQFQDAVASGFQEAMLQYTNKQCEYYCVVKTVSGHPSIKTC